MCIRDRGFILVSVAILSIIVIAGIVCAEEATAVDFAVKNQLPSAGHLFGTDFMGRDMFVRTLAGLSMSIRLGLLTAAFSAVVALAVGLSSALLGKTADMVLGALIDLVMGIPHMLLLILISFACGPVSYTHLDVYKRQQYGSVNPTAIVGPALAATAVSTLAGVVFCKVMDGKG